MQFKVGDIIEFKAIYWGDDERNSFEATVVRRTEKSVWLAYNNKGDGQRYLIRNNGESEFIVINHVSVYELENSRTIYPPKADAEKDTSDAPALTDEQKRLKTQLDAIALLDTQIPYGKHEGTQYRYLSAGYCKWAWENIGCRNGLAEELVFELIATHRLERFEEYMIENMERALKFINS